MRLSRVSVGNTFIACMLTIVGYSINATIVIFDRIRENLKSAGKESGSERTGKYEYYSDTDQKYLYILHYIYYHICSYLLWVYASIREFALPIDGRYRMWCLLFCMYHRCSVVCHENEIRKKYKVEEIGNQKAVAAMQQLQSQLR